jgi:hypothetical protein
MERRDRAMARRLIRLANPETLEVSGFGLYRKEYRRVQKRDRKWMKKDTETQERKSKEF